MGCAHGEERPAGVTGRGRRRLFASGNSAPAVHGNRWLTPSGTLHPVGAARLRNIGEPDIATPRLRRFETPPLRELRARRARVEHSPRLMPRQDESPAGWRGGIAIARGLAPWTHTPRCMRTPPAAQAGVRQHAGDIKRGMGTVRGGEELALLVMKTALVSGMKNSLVLVVKNGLRPW